MSQADSSDSANKTKTIETYRLADNDTGSPEVQVALLTDKLNKISGHLGANPKDKHSYRGLLTTVAKRRSLLDYLKGVSPQRYTTLITSLGIRK